MTRNKNMPTFLTEHFDEPILFAPARKDFATPCQSLKIITAFTDCDRISTHMIALADEAKDSKLAGSISVEILLGMTKSSLSAKKHQEICRLLGYLRGTRYMPRISCRYVCRGAEVHSKVYVWCGRDSNGCVSPQIAYCGSLNYTNNAFYKRRESVSRCDENKAFAYYQNLLPDTIDCFDSKASAEIKNVANASPEDNDDVSDKDYDAYDKEKPIDTLKVSLLMAREQDVGYGSGVNWGIRPNGTKRNTNQAYIPYNTADKKPGFFPDRTDPSNTKENCPIFKVITKDFGSFHMRMAQAKNKALHTAESNAILGEWLRKRLHVPSGGFITLQMLKNYGKTYVSFRKYADGTYLLDF